LLGLPQVMPPVGSRERGERRSPGLRASKDAPEKLARPSLKGKSASRTLRCCMLQPHKAAGLLAYLGMEAMSFLQMAKKRLLYQKLGTEEEADQELELNTVGEEGESRRRRTGRVAGGILMGLRVLAVLSFLLLAFELVWLLPASWNSSWSSTILRTTSGRSSRGSSRSTKTGPLIPCEVHRAAAPIASPNACIDLFTIRSVYRIALFLACLWVKWRGHGAKFAKGTVSQHSGG